MLLREVEVDAGREAEEEGDGEGVEDEARGEGVMGTCCIGTARVTYPNPLTICS